MPGFDPGFLYFDIKYIEYKFDTKKTKNFLNLGLTFEKSMLYYSQKPWKHIALLSMINK